MKLRRFSTLLITTAMFLAGCGDTPAPEHQHQWKDPTYTWAVDYSSCTAERACQTCELKETETVSSTYTVVTPATETDDGLGRYTATFTNTAFTVQTHDVTIPASGGGGGEEIDSFEDAVSSIKSAHNYSVHLTNRLANETTDFANFKFYNINDNALFSDMYGYYSGYIKQKDQGIVTFRMPLSGEGLILGSFVATNLERNVSDYYNSNIEYLIALEQIFAYDFTYSASRGAYVCTSYDAIAMIATMAFGFSTEVSCIAPEDFTAKFENGNLVINAVFEVRYFDVEEVVTSGNVVLTVSNFEETHNSVIEEYVKNPDYTYTAPTEWSAGVKEIFEERYNNTYPPFINGLTYSWDYYRAWNEGFGAIVVEDYFATGSLLTDYVGVLTEADFHEVSNPYYTEYAKVVEDEQLKHTYSVKMKYHAPTELDAGGVPYSYLYPNGLTTFIFLHKQIIKSEITNIGLLNEYIDKSVAKDFLPRFELADDTKVTNCADKTDSESDTYALKLGGIDGSGSAYFNIYPDTKEHAIAFYNKLKTDLAAVGMDNIDSFLGQDWISDDYGSNVRITDPNTVNTWTSSTSLQVRIEITKKSLEEYEKEIVYIDRLVVTDATTTFNVGDEFIFDGTVTVYYTDENFEVVTPTNVIAPDMSQAGQQTVVVEYTDSEGRSTSTNYTVTINAVEVYYDIYVTAVEGVTVNISSHPSKKAKEGETVIFKVTTSKTLKGISVTCGGVDVTVNGPHPMTGAYNFKMPKGDVVITPLTDQPVAKHTITYTIYNEADYSEVAYSDAIADTSVLPTSASENSTVSFSVATKEGYAFSCAFIGEGDAILTPSFTGQMGTGNMEVSIVVYQTQNTPVLSSIALSGYTTQYEVGDTFSFDGVVTASYSNGDPKVVTPTSVSSPDMSTAGRKEVTVSYTEDGTTVTASYYIVVEEGQGGGGEEQSIYGSYTHDRANAFSNPNYYDRYTITLNEDGTGTYVRENHNAAPAIKILYFKYSISGSSITFTFVSGENTDAYNGYRLFPYGPSEGYVPTNATGVISTDGTISVTLYKSGADNGTFTFTKAA